MIDDMGFRAMDQDKCVLKCSPIEGEPPIYVGIYVDNFLILFQIRQSRGMVRTTTKIARQGGFHWRCFMVPRTTLRMEHRRP